MSGFDFSIGRTITDFNDEYLQAIVLKITSVSGKFIPRSAPEFVRVRSDSTVIDAFLTRFSGDEKILSGYFTTDAFLSLTANGNIEFGYGDEITDSFEDIDINANIAPLPTLAATLTVPDADTAWLEGLS